MAEENIWLKGLYNRLDLSTFRQISAEAARQGKDTRIRAYLNAIFQANTRIIQEELRMGGSTLTLEKVLEDAGLIAKWKAEGVEKTARNALAEGASLEFIHKITGLDIETIKGLGSGQ